MTDKGDDMNGDSSLGGFLDDFTRKLKEGTDPDDGCVLCGSRTSLLHQVERAWACSRCHVPQGSDRESARD